MSWTGQEDGVQIIFLDQPVEVNVGQAHARIGAPVTEQAAFDVLAFERLTKQRIVSQIDNSCGKEQRRVPIGLHPPQLIGL